MLDKSIVSSTVDVIDNKSNYDIIEELEVLDHNI